MLDIKMKTQPDDVTCGPTSLQAVYSYYGDNIALQNVIKEVEAVSSGGTLAALLGKHAIQRGYKATLYTYSLELFDPTWFKGKAKIDLAQKLEEQMHYKTSARFREASLAFLEFIRAGGQVAHKDLTVGLLQHYFELGMPIIAGLSATYLYGSAREYMIGNNQSVYDDILGVPIGHFVVLCGYDSSRRHIIVADPHRENPISHDNYYKVRVHRLINAIILGVLTHDANLLVVEPSGVY